jgi:tetratricopeptide (TPR) repeat protein
LLSISSNACLTSDIGASRHESKTIEELTVAIRQFEEATVAASLSSATKPEAAFEAVHLDRLADLYFSKYEITGKDDDLEAADSRSREACDCGRRATVEAPPGHSRPAQWFALQGSRLMLRYERFYHRKDLDDAIDAYGEALRNLTAESGLLGVVLMNQANALCARYEADGAMEDIEAAIQKAQDSLSKSGSNAATVQNDLSTMYLSMYEMEGEEEHLDQAVFFAKEAVDKTDASDARLPTRLLNLSNCLRALYDHSEELLHIEETIITLQKAEEAGRSDMGAFMPQILSRLAHALFVRYKRAKETADLFGAIAKAKEALELAKGAFGNNLHPDMRSHLTSLLRTCSEEAREYGAENEGVLDEAVDIDVNSS